MLATRTEADHLAILPSALLTQALMLYLLFHAMIKQHLKLTT